MSDPLWLSADTITQTLKQRVKRLNAIRTNANAIPALKTYYRANPAQFIDDWGMTFDPRLPEVGLPAVVPFVLFPRQREFIDWIVARWQSQEPGVVEKTRDAGASWLCTATASTLCVLNQGLVMGFGSSKEENVDQIGDPKSLFWKARFFLSHLPREFSGGFSIEKHSPHMRITIPETDSFLSGEAGDNIGRGNRASIYFIDESAFIQRPALIDASLAGTTNCRIDVSTPNGTNNSFAIRRHSGNIPVFVFDWRDDPRKDDAWYARQTKRLSLLDLAREVDRNYSASVDGVVIPSEWVHAAIDAHIKLGINPTGRRYGALDVADEGQDLNAFCACYGPLITHIEQWSGKGKDIFATCERAFALSDSHELEGFTFDSDGLGAGIRGDARKINSGREKQMIVRPFRGSESVLNPNQEQVPSRQNKDYFLNRKAQ